MWLLVTWLRLNPLGMEKFCVVNNAECHFHRVAVLPVKHICKFLHCIFFSLQTEQMILLR